MSFPDISPIALTVFGFHIRWYALAYIAGFLLALSLVQWRLRRSFNADLSSSELDDLLGYGVLGVIIGGRLGYCLFYNFGYYAENPIEILMVWNGGMSFHGGFLGVALTIIWWCSRRGKSLAMVSDLFSLAAPIGLFFGRLANFVNAELYGRPTSLPIGMVFPGSDGLPRHPSQLYEAFLEGIVLFVALACLARLPRARAGRGVLISAFVGLYGIARFAVEFVREPDASLGLLGLGLSMGQWLSLPMILVGGAAFALLWRAKLHPAEFAASPMLGSAAFAKHRFFTRNGGVSKGAFASANCRFETSDSCENVAENRRRLMATMGSNADTSLFTLKQQHTNKVVVIKDAAALPRDYLDIEADALIATKPGLAVGVLTADCLPVLIADPRKKLVAAVHCGWKGLYAGIAGETLKALKKLGSKPADLTLAFGPCLRQKSYEVDADFRAKIVAQDAKYAAFFKPGKQEKYLFDIVAYAVAKFTEAGCKRRKIEALVMDTLVQKDEFFSYRRSSRTGDFGADPLDSGRLLSVIEIA